MSGDLFLFWLLPVHVSCLLSLDVGSFVLGIFWGGVVVLVEPEWFTFPAFSFDVLLITLSGLGFVTLAHSGAIL